MLRWISCPANLADSCISPDQILEVPDREVAKQTGRYASWVKDTHLLTLTHIYVIYYHMNMTALIWIQPCTPHERFVYCHMERGLVRQSHFWLAKLRLWKLTDSLLADGYGSWRCYSLASSIGLHICTWSLSVSQRNFSGYLFQNSVFVNKADCTLRKVAKACNRWLCRWNYKIPTPFRCL